jgi:hypothetical protein
MDNFFYNILLHPATIMNGLLTGWLIFTAIAWGLYCVVKKFNWLEPYGTDGMLYIIASVLVAGIYVSELYLYLTYEAYSDHVEPAIASISWIFTKGSPIYTGIDGPTRYSFAYGPALFMINGYVMKAIGGSILASKLGAGIHHLLPLIPVLIFLFLIMAAPMSGSPSNRAAAVAVLTAFIIVSTLAALKTPIILYAGIKDRASASEITKDLKGILAAYPSGTIEMGCAGDDSYALTFYRPLVVFHSNLYSLDAAALMDNKLSGISMPDATYISSCKTTVWLIPRGMGQPFSMNGYDENSGGLFDAAFRDTFLRHYELAAVSRYFYVWSCKH